MVTMIKHTLPPEEAEQINLGDCTHTLSTRIWLNNKPLLLLHNIYRVDRELHITTPLTREPRSIVGDFNTIDEMWCREHNRAAE